MTNTDADMRPVPKMRTASGIVAELKKLDPDTGVTESMVRRLVKNGNLKAVWSGNKALVDLNDVLTLFEAGTEKPGQKPYVVGGIRRLDSWMA